MVKSIRSNKYLFNADHMKSAIRTISDKCHNLQCSFIYDKDNDPTKAYTNWGGQPDNYFAVVYMDNIYSVEEFNDIITDLIAFMG